jgi:CheY-like chemotaxis protein
MTPLRIMIVEDDSVVSMLLAEVLGWMGHDVCAIATDESYAVAAAAETRPDMMIVDVRLRGGSGVCAVDEILRTGFVPHVFVSGDISSVRALKPDAIAIQKPYGQSDLARAMESALGAASAA